MKTISTSVSIKCVFALCVVISRLAASAAGAAATVSDSDLESTPMTVPRPSRGGTRGGAVVRGTSASHLQHQRQLDGMVITTKDVPSFVEGAGKDDMMAVLESQMERSDTINSSAKSNKSTRYSKSTTDPKLSSTKSQKFKSMKDPSDKSSFSSKDSKKGSKSDKKGSKAGKSKKSKKSRKGLLRPKKRNSPKTRDTLMATPAASAAPGTSIVHKKVDSIATSTIPTTTTKEEETTTHDGGSLELLQDTLDDTSPETYGSK